MSHPTAELTDIQVLIFDVYGTLIDWEGGIFAALQPLLQRFEVSRQWSKKDALDAFGTLESRLQTQFPTLLYSELLAEVHKALEMQLKTLEGTVQAANSTGVTPLTVGPGASAASAPSSSGDPTQIDHVHESSPDSDAHTAFGNSIRNWPLFPDTVDALKILSRYYKLVVLSNVDRESFQYTHALLSEGPPTGPAAATNIAPYLYPTNNPHKFWHPQETPGSESPFTVIATAQDTGCYKPALGGFQALLEYIRRNPQVFGKRVELGGDSGDGDGAEAAVESKVISVAQSLPHDHVPAHQLGMKSAWIDRQSAVTCNTLPGGQAAPWAWRFETLGEMARAVEVAAAAPLV